MPPLLSLVYVNSGCSRAEWQTTRRADTHIYAVQSRSPTLMHTHTYTDIYMPHAETVLDIAIKELQRRFLSSKSSGSHFTINGLVAFKGWGGDFPLRSGNHNSKGGLQGGWERRKQWVIGMWCAQCRLVPFSATYLKKKCRWQNRHQHTRGGKSLSHGSSLACCGVDPQRGGWRQKYPPVESRERWTRSLPVHTYVRAGVIHTLKLWFSRVFIQVHVEMCF